MRGVRVKLAGGWSWTPHVRSHNELRRKPHIAKCGDMWALYSLAGKQSRIRCVLFSDFETVALAAERMFQYMHRRENVAFQEKD